MASSDAAHLLLFDSGEFVNRLVELQRRGLRANGYDPALDGLAGIHDGDGTHAVPLRQAPVPEEERRRAVAVVGEEVVVTGVEHPEVVRRGHRQAPGVVVDDHAERRVGLGDVHRVPQQHRVNLHPRLLRRAAEVVEADGDEGVPPALSAHEGRRGARPSGYERRGVDRPLHAVERVRPLEVEPRRGDRPARDERAVLRDVHEVPPLGERSD